jgi:hypothetical protein
MNAVKTALIVFAICTSSVKTVAQGYVSKIVSEKFSGNKAATRQFDGLLKEVSNPQTKLANVEAVYYELDSTRTNEILRDQYETMSLSIMIESGKPLILDLVNPKENINDFSVVISSSNKRIHSNEFKVCNYMGVVRGEESKSLVALTFTTKALTGFISTENGNYTVAKQKSSDNLIVYNEKSIKTKPFICSVDYGVIQPEERPIYEQAANLKQNKSTSSTTSSRCVKLGYYTEYDIYEYFGYDYNKVVEYVTALHNQVAVIYFNESIRTTLGGINVWTFPDQFNNQSAKETLNQFKRDVPLNTTNGDLVQLLTFRSFDDAGGVANRNQYGSLCDYSLGTANFRNYKHAVSSVNSYVNEFPIYSLSVLTVCHEFGHLFGSNHTHDCVWNGNNSAIDGCYQVVGGCSQPAIPEGGGTIMSYCHNTPQGTNFYNGFGPQPGNVIRSYVNNVHSTCLQSCCPVDLNLTTNVFFTDLQEAYNTITATNQVNKTATAIYHAGNEVVLKDGFSAFEGSFFKAYKAGCSNSFTASKTSIATPKYSFLEYNNKSSVDGFWITPNPTTGIFSLNFDDVKTGIITVYDFTGKLVLEKGFQNSKLVEVNIEGQSSGVYVISINQNSIIRSVKIVKK